LFLVKPLGHRSNSQYCAENSKGHLPLYPLSGMGQMETGQSYEFASYKKTTEHYMFINVRNRFEVF